MIIFLRIDDLRILFNLSYEIFRNESFPKMHESLEVRLFTARNIALLYNNSLIDELIYLLLNSLIDEIDLNRCSTAPLEHNFGISRMSCRDNNRMERLLLQFARIDVRRLKEEFLFNRTMNHRVTNHGSIVTLSEFDHSFDMPDSEIKQAMIPLLRSKNVSDFSYSTKKVIEMFDKIEAKLVPSSRFICKSSDVFVNPSTVTRIQSRLENDLGKRCRWSSKEEELLIKLSKDMGSNCNKLSKYFNERTSKAVFQKATRFNKSKKINAKPFLK